MSMSCVGDNGVDNKGEGPGNEVDNEGNTITWVRTGIMNIQKTLVCYHVVL
ncbi:predicted protein [Sclerotinia sclerotiorum 1980 UF-70]|uniref:Uncharacterized protein n=1 Tax=Sclerotinia sclerotiorum (strain ATCC 18683 / 1980 / Ss-1) TaxID=665079 RepID=A7E9T1_SCLS1|nr:predicted protein [Sclerotinia sclerotiorum 1980 UF-70]EDN97133.1 predicted protein [Sclerotinia sclerotiorum 1980 UF-70]